MQFKQLFGRKTGYALVLVLALLGMAALIAASTMSRTFAVAKLNQRNVQYQGAVYAAEAAVEMVFARVRQDYVNGGEAAVVNNLAFYRTNYPTSAQNSYWSRYEFSDAQNNNNRTYFLEISNNVYQVLDGSYAGLNGWRSTYRTVSNARPLEGLYPAAAGVQQDISLDTIPTFQFAIFYNGQLEFTWCATMTVRGKTHANGPICLGPPSSSSLTFDGTVTTTSSILYSNLGGYSIGNMTGPVNYNGTPKSVVGQPTLQLPIGTNNTAAAVREIINLPPSGEPVLSLMGQQRFYNKAGVVLLVSNATVTLTVKDPGSSGSGSTGYTTNYNYSTPAGRTNLVRYFPFLTLTNTFRDHRESKWVMPTQIDVRRFSTWLLTNSIVTNRFPGLAGTGPAYPNILYVADFRSLTNLHAVRMTNGLILPTNGPSAALASGLTVATPNPLYVWGHYNSPNTSHLGQANVSSTFPASFICDAFTVLSSNWNDSVYSSAGLSSRVAQNTTINAAVLAGTVYSTGTAAGQWSGGVHNLPRLLESWSSRVLTMNTSLVNLFDSAKATAQFQNPGTYYNAPSRNFFFNTNYLQETKLPPGTPCVSVISRAKWTTAPVGTVTYAGP